MWAVGGSRPQRGTEHPQASPTLRDMLPRVVEVLLADRSVASSEFEPAGFVPPAQHAGEAGSVQAAAHFVRHGAAARCTLTGCRSMCACMSCHPIRWSLDEWGCCCCSCCCLTRAHQVLQTAHCSPPVLTHKLAGLRGGIGQAASHPVACSHGRHQQLRQHATRGAGVATA